MKVRLLPILLVWFGLSIALVLAADTAEKAAAGAAQTWLGQIGGRLRRGARERLQQRLAPLHEVERGAPRRARPEPRQPRQKLDQPLDLRPDDGLRHEAPL